MNNQTKGALYGALIADAHALGAHWLYDTKIIADNFTGVDGYVTPTLKAYHTGKKKGEFTHYGDQAAHLAGYLRDKGSFDLKTYKAAWLAFVESHEMYLDHATKESKEALTGTEAVTGSHSDDLGGIVSNCAFYSLENPDPQWLEERIRMTHDNEAVVAIGNFYRDVIAAILAGKKPSEAAKAVIEAGAPEAIVTGYKAAKARLEEEAVAAVGAIGQSCSSLYGLPSSLYLILKFEEDYSEALKANRMAGGDSAARGMVVGMVLGAYHGYDALPQDLKEGLVFSL